MIRAYDDYGNIVEDYEEKIRAEAEKDFQNTDYWNDYLAKVVADERKKTIEEVKDILCDSVPLTESSDIVYGFCCAIQRLEQLKGNG